MTARRSAAPLLLLAAACRDAARDATTYFPPTVLLPTLNSDSIPPHPLLAWRANRTARRFDPIATDNITCVPDGEGDDDSR